MAVDSLSSRSTAEVLEDHLRLAREGRLEEDLARNVAEDVVVLVGAGRYRGHDGVRQLARLLELQLPDPVFAYTTVLTAGEVAFLEWSARAADGSTVDDGADTFVIRDGQIWAQTIHYSVRPGRWRA